MLRTILKELKHHAPFTILGALSGILIMVIFRNISQKTAYTLFYVFHPFHVFLSALVTASLYSLYNRTNAGIRKYSILAILLIGFAGSIGIATLSDSLIPYIGETLLKMPHREAHIGFIEKWWLVTPLAFAGILIAYFKPATKFPHAGHVFISTWASLFHVLMAERSIIGLFTYAMIFLFLFIAVWVPCCLSDIVFPLLFVKKRGLMQNE
ncbi:MAG: hypothetical protein KJ995_03850 [Candidatus Omnitrophica bacterium]|nr:hypothetical protein [Candidatus Omnitrophota bacterium]MBU1127503.1 hypothetical protein [Candidatus Omnitrophota bacterium]MBU1785127.1 hypothetical protein [Candidatus Omnitrophota bacterium]MBU1851520.1 hypothetical protein [Candidatus Omnitrophota bacterium]